MTPADRFAQAAVEAFEGESIDQTDVAIDDYGPPNAGYLQSDGADVVDETLLSDLLKSNCPVTGQPDWASVRIRYANLTIQQLET